MILKDISLKSPQENILYDEVLLNLAEQGQTDEVLRFWESIEDFVVLGRISKERDDIKVDHVRKDRIAVYRRASGGGTVLQGKGCLNYSLILSKDQNPQIADLRKSYKYILGKIVEALKPLGIDAMICPISDIALVKNKMKISGNAQKRSKKFILHHGTILYDFDVQKIEKYLNIPKDIPKYRQGRRHSDFVTNIPLTVDEIKSAIKRIFEIGDEENILSTDEEKYLQAYLNKRQVYVELSGV